MSGEMNRVTVEIFGQYYTIKGTSNAAHMRAVASFVDDKMIQMAKANPRLDTNKLAVLAAVNVADEFFKLRQEYEELIRLLEKNSLKKE